MRLDDKNLVRKLRELPNPEPPQDLLARLIDDIPDSLGATSESLPAAEPLALDPPDDRPASRRPWRSWAAAASLVTLFGGGLLAYRVLQQAGELTPPVAEVASEEAQDRFDSELSQPKLQTPAAVGGEMARLEESERLDSQEDLVADQTLGRRVDSLEKKEEPEMKRRLLEADRANNQQFAEAQLSQAPPPAPAVPQREAGRVAEGQSQRSPVASNEPEAELKETRASVDTAGVVSVDDRSSASESSPVAGEALEALGYRGAASADAPAEPKSSSRDQDVLMDEIVVTAEAPAINVTSTELGASIRSRRKPSASRPETEALPEATAYDAMFFRDYGTNPFVDAEEDALSTFGLDVDTGSFNLVRRYLSEGRRPPSEAVRVEEMVNAMRYPDLEGLAPSDEKVDFALGAEWGRSPWGPDHRYQLLRLTVRAREARGERSPTDLILVVDTSGSMNRENRLGLVKRSLRLLLDELEPGDRLALVTYGSRGRVLLEPTHDRRAVERALESLHSNGSTNAEEGLLLAYELAARTVRDGASQRIILCSDGVANVGRTGPGAILERIGDEARGGVELTTVGFGMGNYNDELMEQLADQGDGRYAYVDRIDEARRLFVEELAGTLQTLGSEARAQVEFNSDLVSWYRLLGYENRAIADHRFRDDTVDAGEIGVGHTVTALYELKLRRGVDERLSAGGELATLRLRYRPTAGDRFLEVQRIVGPDERFGGWEDASVGWRLAVITARFAETLRGVPWAEMEGLGLLVRMADEVAEQVDSERVWELVEMVRRARSLSRVPARAADWD